MKTNILRAVAIALGVSACTIAQAQTAYTAPKKWSNFRPISDDGQEVEEAAREVVDELPAPKPMPLQGADAPADEPTTTESAKESFDELPAPKPKPLQEADAPADEPTTTESATESFDELPAPKPESLQDVDAVPTEPKMPESAEADPDLTGSAVVVQSSPYEAAMSPPGAYAPARLPLAPYFGGVDLLFLTLEESAGRPIASGLGSDFNTAVVRPEATAGFDLSFGRYLHCGQYGLGVSYMYWDPSSETQTRTGAAGSIRAEMPHYRDIEMDAGLGAENIYNIIDGGGGVGYTGATGMRVTRDVRIQGLEVNLFDFGLMGASRIARDCCPKPLLGNQFSSHRACKGYGGATGPLVRGCSGRLRVIHAHGFRWFQAKDDLEFAYNIDGTVSYQATDLYDRIDVENNLLGYQFGSRLCYCISDHWSLNMGGKVGLYGNHAKLRHRVGSLLGTANRVGAATDFINIASSDTSLATLGEWDLGLGYRIGCAWTFRGGYRMIGMTGVATSVDSIPANYYSLASAGQVRADDSFLLHGGYFGVDYNW